MSGSTLAEPWAGTERSPDTRSLRTRCWWDPQKQFTAYPFNGAQDPITNRPLAWTASGGITISASGLATATGNAGFPGYLASGAVEAHAGWFSASEGVQVTSTPPEITASSCTKGAVTYEGAWQYTHYTAHGEAAGTVPGATIVEMSFALETARNGTQFSTASMSGIGKNDAVTDHGLRVPYYEGPVIPGQYEPTGRCIITARDNFGKSVTVVR